MGAYIYIYIHKYIWRSSKNPCLTMRRTRTALNEGVILVCLDPKREAAGIHGPGVCVLSLAGGRGRGAGARGAGAWGAGESEE